MYAPDGGSLMSFRPQRRRLALAGQSAQQVACQSARAIAQAGVSVTESKFLHDSHAGIDREVDVVFDGEPMVISIEVNERGRPRLSSGCRSRSGNTNSFLPTALF